MQGTLLSCLIGGVRTLKDGSVNIQLETQELSAGNAAEIFSLRNKIVVAYLSAKDIDQNEIDKVDKIDPEFSSKSQSQRIRQVLYKLFEQNKEGHKNFDAYYKSKTELYIEHLKSKINS